jgi:hypothetical protein
VQVGERRRAILRDGSRRSRAADPTEDRPAGFDYSRLSDSITTSLRNAEATGDCEPYAP